MKIVITGKNGYISNKLCDFLKNKGFEAYTVDVRDGFDDFLFENTHCIVHCAAIVHKKEQEYAEQYEAVNYRLTAELAKLAKSRGVKHFVFISTMSVYGKLSGEININTPLNPITLYGKTKLKAEKALEQMSSQDFKVTIIRPPMVYGEGCRGNYTLLRKPILPVFPLVDNKRSMIYIDNLSSCIYACIEKGITGIVLPQNSQYVNTSQMVNTIAKCHNKKQMLIKCGILKKIPLKLFKKVFGDLYYNKAIAFSSDVMSFEETIEKTEKLF